MVVIDADGCPLKPADLYGGFRAQYIHALEVLYDPKLSMTPEDRRTLQRVDSFGTLPLGARIVHRKRDICETCTSSIDSSDLQVSTVSKPGRRRTCFKHGDIKQFDMREKGDSQLSLPAPSVSEHELSE